jgi:hypothetical protein
MRTAVSILVLCFAASMSLFAQSNSSTASQANPAASGQPTQITGCLQGKSQEYRLVEKDGTMHLLVGDNSAMAGHVGNEVTLVGYRDNRRDASSSMGHASNYFQVQSLSSDNGKCK